MVLIVLRDLNGQNNEGSLFDKGSTNRKKWGPNA